MFKKFISVFLILVLISGMIMGCDTKEEKEIIDENNVSEKELSEGNENLSIDDKNKEDTPIGGKEDENSEIEVVVNVIHPEDKNTGDEDIEKNNNAINTSLLNSKTSFTTELFKNCYSNEKNTLISPLSVFTALSMMTNGTDNNTLKELETILNNKKIEDINEIIKNYLEKTENNDELHMANSIWIKKDPNFSVKDKFINNLKTYYRSKIYKSEFNIDTINDINNWVNENTKEMIPKIIDEIKDEHIMFLINAIAFDAKWEEEYNKDSVREEFFTNIKNNKQKVDMMYSTENKYIEGKNATGFIKSYDNKRYEFMALLPNKNVDIKNFVKNLSDEKLKSYLDSVKITEIETKMPKFKFEYDKKLNNVLKEMGIKDGFDDKKADFTKLGEYKNENIYINDVLHKTFIEVDEKGTKAAAVTSVGIFNTTSININEPKKVYLDRPFVFLIIDKEMDMPLFIGTVINF